MNRKIVAEVPEDVLRQDLEKYRKLALKLGASDSKIITTDMISVDIRVRIKCIYPKCSHYNTNRNCPPYAMDLNDTRTMVNSFKYAILMRQKVPTETLAGVRTPENLKIYKRDILKQVEILSKVEAAAFYDGYYLAVAFGGGCCKLYYCQNEDCAALTTGKGCKHPLRSRSSLEAIGIDVYLLATRAGWDIYPLGGKQSDAPHGNRIGIVFIY